jgi:hypothetical protein
MAMQGAPASAMQTLRQSAKTSYNMLIQGTALSLN